jgi:hypothetical protein
MEWCNSGGSAPATPGLTAHLPQISAVAMGGPVCDPVRSTTTKPITDHDPHLPGVNYIGAPAYLIVAEQHPNCYDASCLWIFQIDLPKHL